MLWTLSDIGSRDINEIKILDEIISPLPFPSDLLRQSNPILHEKDFRVQ